MVSQHSQFTFIQLLFAIRSNDQGDLGCHDIFELQHLTVAWNLLELSWTDRSDARRDGK